MEQSVGRRLSLRMIGWPPKLIHLAQLAILQFRQLTASELKLLSATTMGQVAYCGAGADDRHPHNDPSTANFWGPERDVRADLIVWLCSNRSAVAHVTSHGLHLHAARVCGQLDFRFKTVRFPLALLRCQFTDPIVLFFATTQFLSFSGSVLPRLIGDGLSARALCLDQGFRSNGGVRLIGAKIGANLSCAGAAILTDGSEQALAADGIKVDGSIFLSDGFHAQGEVCLSGSEIAGNLDCSGSDFSNPGEVALIVAGAKVRSNVILTERFVSIGQVELHGTSIGGTFTCNEGRFLNPGAIALGADNATVEESIFFHGFRAEGEVNLADTQVGGNLEGSGGTFNNQDGEALSADGIMVSGGILFREMFSARGTVRLLAANIGGDLDCTGGKFISPGKEALIADKAVVRGDVFLREDLMADDARPRPRTEIEGRVRMYGAEIGGSLCISGPRFGRGGDFAAEGAIVKGGFEWTGLGPNTDVTLNLLHASVGPVSDDEASWPPHGQLDIDGLVYSRIVGGSANARTRLSWLRRQSSVEPSWFQRLKHATPFGEHTSNRGSLDWPQFKPQPHQQLARVLREAGDGAGARRVLIDLENSRRKYGHLNFFAWLWQWVLHVIIGYGYRPWYALLWAILVVATGSVLFWRGVGLITPTDMEAARETHYKGGICAVVVPDYYQPFSPVVYSLDSFLPIINLGQKDRWMPNPHCGRVWKPSVTWLARAVPESLTLGWFLRLYLWIHVGLGWLLTTLFVAGLTPIIRNY